MSSARSGAFQTIRSTVVWIAMLLALGIATRLQGSAATSGAAPDFTLTDQHGRPFTLSAHRGHPIVLFFGYTNCPDVCPTILANIARARKTIGRPGADLVVALVTVDPDRDTEAELGRYVSVFDPAFLGLRGDRAHLSSVYKAYHVRYSRQVTGGEGYAISHTAFVYYIGRDGRIRGFGTWNDSQPILEESLRQIAG